MRLFQIPAKSKEPPEMATTLLRVDKELMDFYTTLARESGRSRNEVLTMAIRYAMENISS